jgi:hypothetical protein
VNYTANIAIFLIVVSKHHQKNHKKFKMAPRWAEAQPKGAKADNFVPPYPSLLKKSYLWGSTNR